MARSLYPHIVRRLDEVGMTRKELAEQLDISDSAFYEKMHGVRGRRFDIIECYRILAILEIPDEQIGEYFKRTDGEGYQARPVVKLVRGPILIQDRRRCIPARSSYR